MPMMYQPISIADAATYTVQKFNHGMTHFIPDLSQDIVITLPTPDAGLSYEFVYTGVAADAADWQLNTGSDTYFFRGGVLWADTDAGTGAAEVIAFNPDGNSNSKFNVITPDAGTRVRVECADGTTWVLSGIVASATTPSAADA